MKTLKDAIGIIMAQPPELHYPAYYADLLREADVPDKNVGKCSEIPNSSDTISRQVAIDALSTPHGILYPIRTIEQLQSAQPEKRTDKHTEMHACVLIDRQAAIDALGEGAMLNYQAAGNDNGLIKAINVIKGLPSAEPQIIRCKECKHWTNNIGDSKLRDNYCNEAVHGFYYRCSGDDYCSFAERRTNEQ